jgi:cyclopropane fatty-acyl-phospholipid synthase-like methyltransferase
MKVKHEVLDKYERGEGIINLDIIDFKPEKKYDLIVSISAFEYIGFDEVSRYAEFKDSSVRRTSLLAAMRTTRSLLKEKGIFVFTVPLGFNKFLDEQAARDGLSLSTAYFLKRISADNKWIEIPANQSVGARYNGPFPCANVLLVGVCTNVAAD